MGFEQFMADGAYVVERSAGDRRNYVGYRDDKLGIGPDGEVIVADPAWPRPCAVGQAGDLLPVQGRQREPHGPQPRAHQALRELLRAEPRLPGDVRRLGREGEGAYPLQAYTPHYMRRAHTCYDNMVWTQEAFVNPVFMNAQDAAERGIEAGDTVMCFNDFGAMLRRASRSRA